ncbi:hypothetical protein ACFL41_01445 [Gemmatimonadota bacterium]
MNFSQEVRGNAHSHQIAVVVRERIVRSWAFGTDTGNDRIYIRTSSRGSGHNSHRHLSFSN